MCTPVYDFLCNILCRYCGTQVVTQDFYEVKSPKFVHKLYVE